MGSDSSSGQRRLRSGKMEAERSGGGLSPNVIRNIKDILAKEQSSGQLRSGSVDLAKLGRVVMEFLAESGGGSPSNSLPDSLSQPPPTHKSQRKFKKAFSHRTQQMVRKASGTSLLRQNSDSSLCGGNLCSDKSEKKQNRLLRQRAEIRRKRKEQLMEFVTKISFDTADEAAITIQLEAEICRILATQGSSAVQVAFLTVLASLQGFFHLKAFSSNIDGAVRELIRRNLFERVVASPLETESASLEMQLRLRQISVLLTLGGISESGSASLPLQEASLNWLLDQMGWILATGDSDGARGFLDGCLVEHFVELIPRHLARLLLELGRRLPIELAHLEEEAEEVEDVVFPSPLKHSASFPRHTSSYGLMEPAKKRRKDSSGSFSQPLPALSPTTQSQPRARMGEKERHRRHSAQLSKTQKVLLSRLKIDMCEPGTRRRKSRRASETASERSSGEEVILKTTRVAESPIGKQVPQSELRRRRRELQAKQLLRVQIEESPQSARMSPREHASTKAVQARKRSLAGLLAEGKNMELKRSRAESRLKAGIIPPAATRPPLPVKAAKRRSRDAFLGLDSAQPSTSCRSSRHSSVSGFSPPPSSHNSQISNGYLTPKSPEARPERKLSSSSKKSVKRNLRDALSGAGEKKEDVEVNGTTPNGTTSPEIDDDVVTRYRRQIEDLRKDKQRGKLSEDDIFYGRGLTSNRKNVFEAETESDLRRNVSTRLNTAKITKTEQEAKNRSGRRVRGPELAHSAHFLLNLENPNPSAPVVPKFVLQRLKIISPIKMPKLKLRLPPKVKRRSLVRQNSRPSLVPSTSPTSPTSEDSREAKLEACLGGLSDAPAKEEPQGLFERLAASPPPLPPPNGLRKTPPLRLELKAKRAGWEWERLEGLMLSPRNGSPVVEAPCRQRSRSLSESEWGGSRRRSPRLSPKVAWELLLPLPPILPAVPPKLNGFATEEEASHASWQDEDSLH